ncbi:hypothetical protein [Marinicrinis lubricantis]|uniref:Uncharacterized protein n=1 Tax=Marinicrinis lubricantis TaxID=2086470 RepID=A0ABW1ILG5_9BACL
MIPYSHTWPYELIMGDYYFLECPSCGSERVLLPLKKKNVREIQTGKKYWMVLPCCSTRFYITEIDDDYILADIPLRKNN